MAADMPDEDVADTDGPQDDVDDMSGGALRHGHKPGTVAIDQCLLESAFERFNTLKKQEGMNQLRVALGEMGFRLSIRELAAALTTAGLTWGQPTQRQMTEAFNQFWQLHEQFGEDEAIGMVTGMLGFKSTAAARKHLVEAGLLEARKRGRPAGRRAGSKPMASVASTDCSSSEYATGGEDGRKESGVSSKGGSDDGLDPDAPCEVCGETEVGSQGDMLFCDGCNVCFHMSCLTPPLASIPTGDWFCPHWVVASPPSSLSVAPRTRMRSCVLSKAASARVRIRHSLAGRSLRTSLQYSRAMRSKCASRVTGFMYCVMRPCGPATLLKISAGSPVPC
ncbi:hypothetical protein Vafri_15712, partial [Volvox africanus]